MLGLVPRALGEPLARRIGFDDHRMAAVDMFNLVERGPHRLGDAGDIDQPLPCVELEQEHGALFVEFENGGKIAIGPALQLAADRLTAHPDLIERGLDLVERQLARFRQRQPGTKQDWR
jgi:hypothetical protein